ncbi:VTT domain-containing protein [Streptomyces sp. SL13]|uniref:VTT domain-containing protein n=1 Tax=Streptantibioticus silvisoli TaxID=2705255 RepID=A0AA90GU74_9ACTN|nr:VTT domain-containing protein [Streptantibioticus silvisoli]MDI5961552.1 VTT domain-containing protein [Streptantibioticus silvisoli]MDI5968133.1 VTT domain-containing protein [Streptantibioticus silvisoli]
MSADVNSLVGTPWVFVLVGLSVLLDVFVPVLPSGILLISAVTAVAAGGNGAQDIRDVVALLVCAAAASCLGDLAAYRLAYHGGAWLDRRLAGSRRLATAQERLGAVLSHGGGGLVVLARFAPAGRSVMSLGAGAAHRRPAEFLPWSAVAGVAWATYGVVVGWLGGKWLGAGWLGTAMSLVSLVGAGAVASWVFKRERRLEEAAAAAASLAGAAGVTVTPAEAG